MEPETIDRGIYRDLVYEEGGSTYTETTRRKYGNRCTISAGFVDEEGGSAAVTIYVKVEKDNVRPVILFLSPDEAQTVIWALSSVLWSYLIRTMDDET